MPTLNYTVPYNELFRSALHINAYGSEQVTQLGLMCGGGFEEEIDPPRFTTTLTATGTATVLAGQVTLTCGTSINGAAQLSTTKLGRYVFGQTNVLYGMARVTSFNPGATTTIGVLIDANNSIGFRYIGGALELFYNRAGVTRTVPSTDFNGNRDNLVGTFTPDTNFHQYTIHYAQHQVVFAIDGRVMHTLIPTTEVIGRFTGQPYISVRNTVGGVSTTVEVGGLAIYTQGGVTTYPTFYATNKTNNTPETRLLKAGAGVLQSINVTKTGANTSQVAFYDGFDTTGTLIGVFDLAKDASVGQHIFGLIGLTFDVGLFYSLTGNPTGASFTTVWH